MSPFGPFDSSRRRSNMSGSGVKRDANNIDVNDVVDGAHSAASSAIVWLRRNEPHRGEPSMGEVSTIGLDIAKSVFQVHGVDTDGMVVIRRRVGRAKVLEFLPVCRLASSAWKLAP